MNRLLSYTLLLAAVLSFASAASAFLALGDVPPPLKPAWRVQITTLAQLLPCLYDWYKYPESCKLLIKSYIYLPISAGICFGLHFILWNISLNLTSVAHSLLFLCSDPVILVMGYLAAMKKVRRNDAIGVMIAMIGMVLVSFDYSRSNSTWYGDLISLAGCASAVVYLLIGKQALDTHKFPLWSYLILVNGSGSLFCLLISGVFYGNWDYFGWMTVEKAGYAIMLGLAPGFFGHTAINYLTKSLRPVIITTFINFEPIFGSFIGWFVGYQGIPGYFTWIGGFVMIIGNLVITLFEDNKPKKEKSNELDIQILEKEAISINELLPSDTHL